MSTPLEINTRKSQEALKALYALRDNPMGNAYYFAYCKLAVELLEYLTRTPRTIKQ